MATAFNLTAQINLRGPSNVRNIVSDIRRQLGTITGDVNLRINPATTRNVSALNSALTTLNNNLSATTNNATNAANAIRQFGAAISSIGNGAAGLNRNLNNTATAANNAAAGMTNTARQTRAASSEMTEFGRTAGLAVRRFAAFSLSAGAIMGLTNAIRKGVDAFIEYDKQFVKLQQVTGESASGLSQLAKTITGLSTSLGVSSTELTDVSLTLAQAGLTARDTERALKALALSSLAPSFDNMNQTVEGSIALMRQFGISANDLEKSLGAVNAVSAKFAVEASDIIAAIQRTGGVFASASKGVSEGTDALNEFIAVFTSVRATTRESAETIATGLRTIFTRIQRGGTIEALKEFGVNLTDAEGKFVGAYKAVQLLSEGLNKIDPRDLKFSQIVEELGGFRQIGKVIPLIQQFATAQDALRVAQQGQGSLAADAAKAQASLANQAAKVREEFLALFREIGGSDTFQALAKGALSLASALISVADSVKGVLPVLAIMTAFRGASAVRQFGTGFLRGLRPGGAKSGGYIKYAAGGGVGVPVALMPGEAVIYPEDAAKIGNSTLRRMNYADKRQKRAGGGKIGIVPGQGNSDSFYTTLPEGSFVIRKAATQAMGPSYINDIARGRQKFAPGGLVEIANRKPSLKSKYDINQDSISGFFIDRRRLRKQRTTYRDEAETIVNKASQLYMTGDVKKKIKPMSDEARELADSYIYRKTAGLSARLTKKDLRTTTAQNPRRLNKVQGALAELTVENKLRKAGKKPRKLPYPGGADYTIGRTSFVEVKNKKEATDDLELKAKALLGYAYTTSKGPTYYKNRQQDIVPKLRITLQSNNPQDFGYGGMVQKLMAGQFVKSRRGRKTRQILSDITMSDAAAYPASKIIGELGAVEVERILSSAGVVGISANDFLRKYKLDPTQQQAKQLVLSKYVEKINAKAAANRAGNSAATESAASRSTLFGAIGMFGSAFPPEDLQIITDPKKPPITVRAFGAVLDKNKIMRKARLADQSLTDAQRIDIASSPTASALKKKYLKEDLGGAKKRSNQNIIKEVLQALSGGIGTKAFFDFDKTLAFNTNPAGYTEKKLKRGQKSKNPDYTAFGDISKVEQGLLRAKPSMLLLKLVQLVNKTRRNMPDQLSRLLSSINVVTARPQNTMGAIATWLAKTGLPIPLSNIRGVGGSGMSSKDVAIAKANTILEMSGSSPSIFVDDDKENISGAESAGIRSLRYGAGLKMNSATKKALADSQGSKFQNDVTLSLAQTPEGKRILTAMENDTQQRSIDFPYGIGAKLATNWFNNPLLASIPVDAKRTLTGPRGKISTNITNFLKARRFAVGGGVRDPKNTLEKYFDKSSALNAGLIKKGLLPRGGQGRKEQAARMKDMRSMETVAPSVLYSSLSRKAFNMMAMQIGLNKNPNIPEATRYNDIEKLYNENIKNIIGKTFSLPGYASTSKTFSKAKMFLDNAPRAKDNWAAMMTIMTKKSAKGVDVVDQLKGRKTGKAIIDKKTGQTFYQKPPQSEDEFILRPRSRFRITKANFIKLGAHKNLWMDVQQFSNGGSLYKNDKNKKAGYDPKKLAQFLGATPAATDKQKKLSEMLKDGKIEKPNYEELLKQARGYASGGDIPIMAQEGEYVINRNSAKAIGYKNLHRLNKYHSGGVVQKFARGSTVRPLEPGQYMRSGSIYDIRAGEADALQQREDEIRARVRRRQQQRQQMTEATPQARTLRRDIRQQRGERIQAIQKKYGTDILDIDQRIVRIKQAALKQYGVNLTDSQAMNQLMKMSLKSDREIAQAKKTAVMQYKQGLKGIVADTSGVSSPYNPRAGLAGGNTIGQDYYDKQVRREVNQKTKERRLGGIGGALRSTGLRASNFVSNVLPETLKNIGIIPLSPQEQARNAQTMANNRIAPIAAGRRASASVRDLTQSDAFRALDPAAKKQALVNAGFGRDGAGSQAIMRGRNRNGGGGGGGGGGGSGGTGGSGNSRADRSNAMMNRAMGLAFAIPMITDMFAGGEAKTESQARSNALVQGSTTAVGSGLMMGSMVGEMFGGTAGMIAGLGAAAFGVAKAMIDAENAAREFAITAASTALESATERASKSLDLFSKDTKNAGLEIKTLKDIAATTSAADTLEQARGKTKRGFVNFFDTGEGSAQRSDILFEKGIDAYLQSAMSQTIQSATYASMIPAKSIEAAKSYSAPAELSTRFLEEKFNKGTNIEEMIGTREFDKLTKSLVLSDAAIQEEIMLTKNLVGVSEQEKNIKIANIMATQGEIKAREIQNRVLKEKALEELNRSANHLQNSLERMFQNMEQAIGRNVFELNNLSQQAELSAAALSGNAKAGQVSLKSINVLQNPRAYSSAERNSAAQNAANMFGSESGTMRGLLQAGGTIEDTIMSTINKTIKEDPTAGNEKIGIRIQSSISQALEQLQLPPDISAKLGKQVNEAIGQIRKKGDEKIDFGDLMEKIPQLGKVMDVTRRAQEAALKALEHWQNGLNDYANSMNQMVDLQVEANSRMRRASDIQARGQMELDKVLGKEISLRDQMNVATAGIRSQTGGTIDPAAIAQNIRRLEDTRATQQSMSNTAGQRGFGGAEEFRLMQDRLRNTNIALRENYDALKNMADNTEMASIAMAKINEIQQKRQAGVNMAERLVTSSPQELSQLNRAMDRLNNNMQGGINFGSSAEQRKESLDAFNMIAPFLGEKQNAMKANVLESMLMESGVGVNPMMAEVLQSLRNPEGDPEMQAAIAEYKKAVALQELANKELGHLNEAIAKNTEETAATKLASVMGGFKFTFEGAQLNDVVSEIKALRQVVEQKPGAMAPGKANGGIIYAAAGQFVNFQPKGTDTVPAMLTPGEFVVNRSATQKHLPLLNKINSGGYSSGGKVKYYADGGYVAVDEKWNKYGSFVGETKAAGEYKSSRSKELESEKTYPVLNDNRGFSETQIDEFWRPYYALKGTFYATTDSPVDPLAISNGERISYNTFDIPNKNLNTVPTLGRSYDEVYIGPSGKFEIKYPPFYDDPLVGSNKPIGILPFNIDKFKKFLFDPTSEKQAIPEYSADSYVKSYEAILKLIETNNIVKNGRKPKGRTGTEVNLDPPSNISSLNPSVDVKGGGVFGVKGLTSSDDSLYFLMEKDNLEKLAKPGTNIDSGRNIIGPTFTGAYTEYGINPRIASGASNLKRLIGNTYALQAVNAYGELLAQNTINYGGHTSLIRKSHDLIPDQIQFQKEVYDAASIGLKDLKTDKFNKQTDQSRQLQEKISNFQNLFNNTAAYSELDILGSDAGSQYASPIRLYNENISKKWSDYSGQIERLKAQKQFNFSAKDTDFVRMKNLGNNEIKSFAWTDAGFTPEDYTSVFGNIQDNIELVKKNVNSKIEEYNKNGIEFNYRKYLNPSRLYDTNSNGYYSDRTVDPSLIVIEPQSPDISPRNPFSGGIIPQGSVFWTKAAGREIDRILREGKGIFGTTKYVDPALYPNVEPFTLSSVIDPRETEYDFSKFVELRKKEQEKVRNQEAAAYAKTDFMIGEYAKINDAKRITLARAFYDVAKNDKDVPPLVKSSIGKEITSVADIGNTAISIGSKIPKNSLEGTYDREKLDAWRAVFAEIYLGKDLEKLQNFGIDLSDKMFEGEKVEGTTDLGETYTKYWKTMNVNPDLLKQIVNRQIMSKMTRQTSTKFIQTEKDKIQGDSYAFGSTGQGKVESSDQATPDSWTKLKKVALDPQRIFPNTTDRNELIEKLKLFYQKGKNKYGDLLLPENLRAEKTTRLERLGDYFAQFDRLLNTGLKLGESEAKNEDSAKEPFSSESTYLYKYFEDSLRAISSEEGKTNWNKFSSGYQKFLNLETGRDTLNANQVETLIRASAQLKEEDAKKKEQNAGVPGRTPETFATGGMVYASKGTLVNYQPRGTDTVPAMLTPGEFVVNRTATQKHLPVLKAINEGHYSRGGIVKYLSNGGIIFPNYYSDSTSPVASNNKMFYLSSFMGDIFGQITSAITTGFQNASSAINGGLTTTTTNGVSSIDSDTLNKISEFTNRLKSVADTLAGLSAIPQEITITATHTHNVIINGDEALNKLSPDLQEIAMSTIREKFAELAAANQIAGAPVTNPFDIA